MLTSKDAYLRAAASAELLGTPFVSLVDAVHRQAEEEAAAKVVNFADMRRKLRPSALSGSAPGGNSIGDRPKSDRYTERKCQPSATRPALEDCTETRPPEGDRSRLLTGENDHASAICPATQIDTRGSCDASLFCSPPLL
jgi:hypothetical protein